MIASLLLFSVTLADLTDEQITKLVSRLQSKAEQESRYRHYTRGTTYAIPHSNVPPAVPFTHRVMTGIGSPGPKSRITIRSPEMPNPKGCRCMPHCRIVMDSAAAAPASFSYQTESLSELIFPTRR